MGGPHEVRFPELFELWMGHDLGKPKPGFGNRRPWFYEGLRREDEPVAWRFIEAYLLRYGLWGIPFPGSVSMGEYLSPKDFGMPGRLAERVLGWQAAWDRLEPGDEAPTLVAEGLEVAREVKLFLGGGYYVEFRPFREISIQNGGTVELDVPSFVTGLGR